MKEITNASEAINVLIQAAKIGQAKGAYSLEDAALVAGAIRFLVPPQEVEEEGGETANESPASKKPKRKTPAKA